MWLVVWLLINALIVLLLWRRKRNVMTCGCSKEAKYLVYETREPHCLECMLEAIECREWIEVRWLEDELGIQNQSK